MNDHPTALGGRCSARFDALRSRFTTFGLGCCALEPAWPTKRGPSLTIRRAAS